MRLDANMVTTTDVLAGYRVVRSLGLVEGLSMTRSVGLQSATRQDRFREVMREAFIDMLEQATARGATAVVGMRYSSPSSDDERIVLAYGTAVIVEKT